MLNDQIKSLSVFAIIGFWPVGILIAFLFSSVALTLFLEPTSVQLLMEGILFSILPLFVIFLAHQLFYHHKRWRYRGWIVYGGLFLISIILNFVASAAIGGSSMAAAEGVAGAFSKRYIHYFQSAVSITLIGNILIVPWTLLVIYIFKTINQKSGLWSEENSN